MKSDLNSVKLTSLIQRWDKALAKELCLLSEREQSMHQRALPLLELREKSLLWTLFKEREKRTTSTNLSLPLWLLVLYLCAEAVEHALMSPPSLHSSGTPCHLVHCHHERSNTGWPPPAHPPTPNASTPQVSGHSSLRCAIYLFRSLGPRLPFLRARKKKWLWGSAPQRHISDEKVHWLAKPPFTQVAKTF